MLIYPLSSNSFSMMKEESVPRIQSLTVRLTRNEVTQLNQSQFALTDQAAQDVQSQLGHATENVSALLVLREDLIYEGTLHFMTGGTHSVCFVRKTFNATPRRTSRKPPRISTSPHLA